MLDMAKSTKSKRGGAHRGWRVVERGDQVWQGQAKVPGLPRYEVRTFHGSQAYAAACVWAEKRAAEFTLARPSDTAEVLGLAPARVPTLELAQAMAIEMRRDGLSEGHIIHCLRMATAWAAVVPDLGAASAGDRLAGWFRDRDVAPATHNRQVFQGRRFVAWLHKRGHLRAGVDPLARVELRKVPGRIKEQFTAREVQHLLHQVDDHMHPLYALLIYTGTRISEALAIRWGDIEHDGRGGGVILLRQRRAGTHKTGERVVPYQAELAAILEPRRRASERPVVALYRGNANRVWDHFLAAYGAARAGLTPHSTRHTYCGMMTATGEPTALVAQYAGHDEAQTHHYAALASRHRTAVEGWPRGQLCYLAGWCSPWPRSETIPLERYPRTRQTLRTRGRYLAAAD
jgi:integrase